MRGIILRDRQELDCWDLSIILWSYSKFELYEVFQLYADLETPTLDLIEEMTSEEFLYVFRGYIEMKADTPALISAFLNKINECLYLKSIDADQVQVLIWGLTNVTSVEISADIIRVIQKLEVRLRELQALAVVQEQDIAE